MPRQEKQFAMIVGKRARDNELNFTTNKSDTDNNDIM